MPLGTALILGLLGGLHCAGMCGPLMIALPPGAPGRARFVAGRVLYQLGRTATYAALGIAAGLAGRTLTLAGVQQGVSIALGVLLLVGLLVSPRFLQLPWAAGAFLHLRRWMGTFLHRRSLVAMTTLGALNGLLPCGLVYAACAGAAATGAALPGAAYMTLFGLGTIPVMLGISLTGHMLPQKIRFQLRHLVPVTVGIVACLLILRGLSLGIPYLSPDTSGGTPSCCSTPGH